MEEKKNNRKQNVSLVLGLLTIIGIAGGLSYAFFNYTRTGTTNTLRVGKINFVTTQKIGNEVGAINLINVFPISSTAAATDNDNSGEVVITITGDTDYSHGVEYVVTATGVTNTVGGKTVPISIIVTPSGTLGTESSTYYTARSSATSHIYKIESESTVENNGRLMVGYIAPNTTQGTASGINGTLTIRAYIDSSFVAISDTTPEEEEDTNNDGHLNGTTNNWINGRRVFTTTEWNSLQSEAISFKVKVEANEGIWVKKVPVMSLSVSSGTVNVGSNTTAIITTTGDGTITCQSSDITKATCSIDTTNNTLTVNGVSAGNAIITVNQAEGTNYGGISTTYEVTVDEIPTIASCPGCLYGFNLDGLFYLSNYGNSGDNVSTETMINIIEGGLISENYTDAITNDRKYFMGVVLSNGLNGGTVEQLYVCGIKGEAPNADTPFCIPVAPWGSTSNDGKIELITTLWNDPNFTEGRCTTDGNSYICSGSISVQIIKDRSFIFVGSDVNDYNNNCRFTNYGGTGSISCS